MQHLKKGTEKKELNRSDFFTKVFQILKMDIFKNVQNRNMGDYVVEILSDLGPFFK
jgi:hypothetical protein